MQISTESIKTLREKCGAGVMDCRNALLECQGNEEKAIEVLKEKGFRKAVKKAERETSEGLIEAYIHTGGRVGVIVEINCETDFVTRTDEFKELAHELSMQVAAMCPKCITKEELPEDEETAPEAACLLLQPYIRDPSKTVNDLIVEAIAKTGENIRLKRFARFELGG